MSNTKPAAVADATSEAATRAAQIRTNEAMKGIAALRQDNDKPRTIPPEEMHFAR
jgi:hypothetical protein